MGHVFGHIVNTISIQLKIYCDNFANISLLKQSFPRSKCIDTKYLFVEEELVETHISILSSFP